MTAVLPLRAAAHSATSPLTRRDLVLPRGVWCIDVASARLYVLVTSTGAVELTRRTSDDQRDEPALLASLATRLDAIDPAPAVHLGLVRDRTRPLGQKTLRVLGDLGYASGAR